MRKIAGRPAERYRRSQYAILVASSAFDGYTAFTERARLALPLRSRSSHPS
jgi:hypothetical protein